MSRSNRLYFALALSFGMVVCQSTPAVAAGGPLGIDHRLGYDNRGIWNRSIQKDLVYALAGGDVLGGLWEGGNTRLGHTFWQSIDATGLSALSSQALKLTFTRKRPSQSDSPNEWFRGSRYQSFPSGEVAAVSAVVTPFVLEYGPEDPWIYGLEVLPAYDAVARMKVHGHWQTDVLAGFAVGTLSGYYAHSRKEPFLLSVLPDGVEVGLRYRW